jgi:hypothetical protein
MPIDSGLNSLLSVLALSDATKAAVAQGLPTCEDLEDLFLTLAADKTKVEAMLRHIVDEKIVSDIDIRRIMFVFDWFMMNIVDPNFAWSNFTRSVYVADKRARAVLKHAPSISTPVSQSTTSAVSTIDFSSDVLAADAQRQATPAVPGTVATLKPYKLWTSPFAANTRKGNTQQLHSTYLVLASSLAFDVIEFYRKLVAASKPLEIDLIPFASFDPACALWPSNRCAEVILEMNDALALRLDQTGTLNLEDKTIQILYQKHIIDSTSGVRAYAFLHALLKKAKRQMHEKMPAPPDIDHATSIGSFGSNLEKYHLQLGTIGIAFDEKTQSRFFVSALQQKGIEIDRFVDRLDNVPDKDPLPEELTLTELIFRIKDIRSLNNSSPAIINRFTRSAPDLSSPHQHDRPPRQPRNPDARSDPRRQAGSDTHNARSLHPRCHDRVGTITTSSDRHL